MIVVHSGDTYLDYYDQYEYNEMYQAGFSAFCGASSYYAEEELMVMESTLLFPERRGREYGH